MPWEFDVPWCPAAEVRMERQSLANWQVKESQGVRPATAGLLNRLLVDRDHTRRAWNAKPEDWGRSWEGFVIENLIRTLGADERRCYVLGHALGCRDRSVWCNRALARLREIRLVKRTSSPAVTRSMRSAVAEPRPALPGRRFSAGLMATFPGREGDPRGRSARSEDASGETSRP